MKKRFYSVFLFLALSAVTTAQATSTNYEKTVTSPDGSVTIINPKIIDPLTGNNAPLMYSSNPHGTCLLFGFGEYITYVTELAPTNDKAPRIFSVDATGIISNIDDNINTEQTINSSNASWVMSKLVCRSPIIEKTVSTQYSKKTTNKDGSVTILEPRFNYDGNATPIVWQSSYSEGVCKLFGYAFVVDDSNSSRENTDNIYTNKDFKLGAVINQYGNLSGLQDLDKSSLIYERIGCRNPAKVTGFSASKIIKSDDGTVGIIAPVYKENGHTYALHYQTSWSQVCAAFGYVGDVYSFNSYSPADNKAYLEKRTGTDKNPVKQAFIDSYGKIVTESVPAEVQVKSFVVCH